MPESTPLPSPSNPPEALVGSSAPLVGSEPLNPDDVPTLFEGFRVSTHQKPQRWLGDYELLEEVARGGMGVVYRARHIQLKTEVALKMILSGPMANDEDLERFRIEAEAAHKLKHENIVGLLDYGVTDGNHYFTMEYIHGRSLAQRIAQGSLPCKVAARYLFQIAQAMGYAHQQGILHRDLKPNNVLVDLRDDVHITDFGLAKRLNCDGGQTRTGVILGTPSYMAPEQASGKIHELGPACDIYGMGAILYEMLTGRPPFKAETPLDTVMQVLHNDPVPPRLLNPRIDADLETICLKCLEKDARHRYESAAALAADLQRYLDGKSISAHSFNLIDRLVRSLQHSHLDVAFHAWSTMLFCMAGAVCVEKLAVFALLLTGQPTWQIYTVRVAQWVVLVLLFLWHRGTRLLPTNAAERELWSIWIGFFLAFGSILAVLWCMSLLGMIQQGPCPGCQHWEEILPYPFLAIAGGLAFFSMGTNYWGGCYVIGVGFIITALLMPLWPRWTPLEFGLLWTTALTALAVHLRSLGKQATP